MPYGQFLAEVVNFLIVAGVLFLFVVKMLGWLRAFNAKPVDPPPPTKEVELLIEIRDLLKKTPA